MCKEKRQLFVFMSVFKKKEMAIDHLFQAISLFCCGVSIALSMNKHVPKVSKRKVYPNECSTLHGLGRGGMIKKVPITNYLLHMFSSINNNNRFFFHHIIAISSFFCHITNEKMTSNNPNTFNKCNQCIMVIQVYSIFVSFILKGNAIITIWM